MSPQDEPDPLAKLLSTPVISASKRLQTYLEAPQAMEVITREQIRQMGAFRLQDILRQATSIKLLEMEPLSTYAGMRGNLIEGYPKNIQVLIDGVPFYNGVRGAVDLDNLPIPVLMIDRIEIVRGPSSPLYGAGAVGGVIAIYTGPSEEAVASGRVALAQGRERHAFSLARHFGELRIQAGLDGSSQGDTGAPIRPLGPVAPFYQPTPTQLQQLEHDASHQGRALLHADLEASGGRYSLAAGGSRKITGVNFGTGFTVPYERFENHFVRGGWQQGWSDLLRTDLTAHTQTYKAVTGPYSGGESTLVDQDNRQVSLQVNVDPPQTFHVVAGWDLRMSTSSSILGPLKEVKDQAWGAFAIVDWSVLPEWSLSLGGRYENDSLGGPRVSPRVVVNWQPSRDSNLRFGYYTSARSPQVLEARIFASTPSRIIPNPDLKVERTNSLEIGYRVDWEGWTLDATLFEMRYDDLIARMTVLPTPPPSGTRQYVNVGGTARSRGLEWLLQRSLGGWTYGLNGTQLTFRDRNQADYVYTPKTTLNAFCRFEAGAWTGFAGIHYQSAYTIGNYLGIPTFEPVGARVRGQAQLTRRISAHLSSGIYGLNLGGPHDAQGAGGALQSPILRRSHQEVGASLTATW